MSSDSVKKRRKNLMRVNPHCYWCGVEVVDGLRKGGTIPDNFATVDHLFDRVFDIHRRWNPFSLVLSCYRCNFQRNVDRVNSVPFWLRWKKGWKRNRWITPQWYRYVYYQFKSVLFPNHVFVRPKNPSSKHSPRTL